VCNHQGSQQHLGQADCHMSMGKKNAHTLFRNGYNVKNRDNLALKNCSNVTIHMRYRHKVGYTNQKVTRYKLGWLERCAGVPKFAGSNLSSGSESSFRSDLLLTARGSSTWAPVVAACLLCYPGNTLLSVPRAIQ
jgi:hypothetical protein